MDDVSRGSEHPGVTDADQITSVDQLRSIYAEPPAATKRKLAHLDRHCRSWIGLSPLVFVATSDADGSCDVGPKGGPPGFVRVLDDKRLAWADLSGNNKLDGMRNLLRNSGVALVFVIPGVSEVLRVSGRARITADPATAERVAIGQTVPRVSVICDVEEAWLHCGKALRRSSAWDRSRWPDTSQLASYGRIIRDHNRLPPNAADVLDSMIQKNYETHEWTAGGGDPYADAGL
jgi:uncharacterized protein